MQDNKKPDEGEDETTGLTPGRRVEFSSPVCYADQMDDVYMGFASGEELVAAFNELLEAERAGARITLRSVLETDDPGLKQLVIAIHHDEVQWCGVLIAALQSLGATPSTRTGAFYDKAMAVADLHERLALINRGQAWVVKKLQALLPRIRDERLHDPLAEMLASHLVNIGRVDARLDH